MKLIAILKTTEYRGTYTENVDVNFDIMPGESVSDLWKRVFATQLYRGDNKNPEIDSIVIKGVYPAPTGGEGEEG